MFRHWRPKSKSLLDQPPAPNGLDYEKNTLSGPKLGETRSAIALWTEPEIRKYRRTRNPLIKRIKNAV